MPWWSLQKGKMQRCGDPMNQWILWILIKQCRHVASWTQEQTWCHQIFDLWMGFYGFDLVAHSGLGCWRWSHHEGAQGSSEGALFILEAFDFKFFNGIKMQFVSSIVNEMLMRRFSDSQGLTIYIHFAKSVEEKLKPASKVPPQQVVQTAPRQIRETASLGSCLDERRSIYSELS